MVRRAAYGVGSSVTALLLVLATSGAARAALPPPPPAPPSPFVDEGAAEPPAPAERPTLGKVLRGRGGRGGRSRSRWDGTCSYCGRMPQVTRRKDLEAAGWDLDDAAAACPQCRGVG